MDKSTNSQIIQNKTKSTAFTQTSRTSKISKGTISSLSFKIKLCCGVLELDCMRLLSLISLFINIAAFIIVAGVTIDMFNITQNSFSKVLIARGDALNTNELMLDIVRVGALSRNNSEVDKWYVYKEQMIDALDRFFEYVDPVVKLSNFNNGSKNGVDMYTLPLMEEIIILLKQNNYDRAFELYQGGTYQNATTTWYKQQSTVFNSVKTDSRDQDDLVYNSSTGTLIVVCVSLAVVIPIVIVMTILNIRRESTLTETLQNSRVIQLMDTMNDSTMSKFFKQACTTEKKTDSYFLLAEIMNFNKMKDEADMKTQANHIYQKFLVERKQSFRYINKAMVSIIGKEIQDAEGGGVFNVSLFREMELCVCSELIPTHRIFMKTIKGM
ncbi:hypothetical protein NAEGRDRAFT_57301 [Naegleria gruberi]|uniref:RGS domain-containing protein n=1 Tax=Naegleria gruberi TaxID=5762 RepID=D2V6L4_NAEGR|nr:uncharacterized protein NAEGRDRAFT_57301 [Naegleria gruberi]EFC47598.1 hypothetical protein NAEGRDRAFT_57301 [Naegleria gruberi]|eukprot:XP_002680342.1 hypothetical protein NAEGRDRAFT_57301 [Naegleria gruberi strain NEG-M]